MNDDHDMTRHLPNAERCLRISSRPSFADTGRRVSEQASAVTQALPVEPTQTLPVAETEAMPVEKVAVPQTETKSLPVDSASTEKLSAEPLAAGAVSDESAAPWMTARPRPSLPPTHSGVPPPLPISEPAMFRPEPQRPAMFLTKGSLLPPRHPQARAHATA